MQHKKTTNAILTLGHILQAHVEHGIVQSSSHQEFQTQVVNALGIAEGLALLGLIPVGNEAITEGQTGGRVRSGFIAVKHATRQGGLDMADNLLLKAILVGDALDLVPPPCFALGFGDRGWRKKVALAAAFPNASCLVCSVFFLFFLLFLLCRLF